MNEAYSLLTREERNKRLDYIALKAKKMIAENHTKNEVEMYVTKTYLKFACDEANSNAHIYCTGFVDGMYIQQQMQNIGLSMKIKMFLSSLSKRFKSLK